VPPAYDPMTDPLHTRLELPQTLLIFPPVWTPVTPYLALPALVGYLKSQGHAVCQYDASLDFFINHLLTRKTLSRLMGVVMAREGRGEYASTAGSSRRLLDEIKKNPASWEKGVDSVKPLLGSLRGEETFYDPAVLVHDQSTLYKLLNMASLAYSPASFTFNTFTHPGLTSLGHMLDFADNEEANPFLDFFQDLLTKILTQWKPSLVGISVTTSHQLAGGLTLARLLKKADPRLHVTLGGRHVLRLKEAFARDPSFFPEFCDSLIVGNGEGPLSALIHHLGTNKDLGGVEGFGYYSEGGMVFNETVSHVPISDLPPPDFDALPLGEYLSPTPILPIRLSEGCYWGKCTFCSRYDNRTFQTIPPKKAAEQIEALHKRYGATCFTVNDDCLTPPYLEQVSREIVETGLKLQISLWCKPVASFTADRLRLLSEAGVRLIRWGIETGHPRILKLMNKGTRLDDTIRVLDDAAKAGIWNHATVIVGFPTETEEEARETVRFLQRNQVILPSSIFFRFTLLSNSYISQHPEAFNLSALSERSDLFSYEYRYKRGSGMDEETLDGLWAWLQRYRINELYDHPFWFYIRIREYLLLHVARYGVDRVRRMKVRPGDLTPYACGSQMSYFFGRAEDIPQETLSEIQGLIALGEGVGTSWIDDNLKRAFLIGYAVEEGRVVGTMTLKRPPEKYVHAIEQKTHVDLGGYLERGYSSVRPEYKGIGVGDALLKGLVSRAPAEKIYVTIRMDNLPAVKLTRKNDMRLAATFRNERTGHEIGLFVNQRH
jgi:anaerobic magnesium-protoporphyrin IX monomethyl ester cyclase